MIAQAAPQAVQNGPPAAAVGGAPALRARLIRIVDDFTEKQPPSPKRTSTGGESDGCITSAV